MFVLYVGILRYAAPKQNRQQRLQQHIVDAGMVIGSMKSEQILIFRTCVVLFVQNNIIIISLLT